MYASYIPQKVMLMLTCRHEQQLGALQQDGAELRRSFTDFKQRVVVSFSAGAVYMHVVPHWWALISTVETLILKLHTIAQSATN